MDVHKVSQKVLSSCSRVLLAMEANFLAFILAFSAFITEVNECDCEYLLLFSKENGKDTFHI